MTSLSFRCQFLNDAKTNTKTVRERGVSVKISQKKVANDEIILDGNEVFRGFMLDSG